MEQVEKINTNTNTNTNAKSKGLEFTPFLGKIVTVDGLRFREAPSTDAKIGAIVMENESFYVVGEKVKDGEKWYEVEYKNKNFYAMAKYILNS